MTSDLGSKQRPIEFGFMMGLSPREPIGRFGQLAQLAESLGFDTGAIALYHSMGFVEVPPSHEYAFPMVFLGRDL